MKTITTTTVDKGRFVRQGGAKLLTACGLLLWPIAVVQAAGAEPNDSLIASQARCFGAAVKRDTQVVRDDCKEAAHRVAVAARAVGHEIASSAKRIAAETRSALHAN